MRDGKSRVELIRKGKKEGKQAKGQGHAERDPVEVG